MSGRAYGEQNPTGGELAVSWQTWDNGAGGPVVINGDVNWGRLMIAAGDIGHSPVVDLLSATSRKFVITPNKYGSGDTGSVYRIRGSATPFNQDDVSPSWSLYTSPVTQSWRYVQVRVEKAAGNAWYVDNAVVGGLHNGTSWSNAWSSFASINWASVSPGDSVYISGGSTEKIYNEGLILTNAVGSADALVTVTVGANSPSPSGHDGLVVIDGQFTRLYGILCTSKTNYVRINGGDGSNDRKLYIRNMYRQLTRADTAAYCIQCYRSEEVYPDTGHIYIDYVDMLHDGHRGVTWDGMQGSRLRGCYFHTSHLDLPRSGTAFYTQYGFNNIVEDNIGLDDNYQELLVGGETRYNDIFQIYYDSDIIVRNNYLAWEYGRGNSNCGTLMCDANRGTSYYYNNVVIGCSENPSEMFQFEAIGVGNLYILNNSVVTQHPTLGKGIHFNNAGSQTGIAAIKNNILYSPNGLLMVLELGLDANKADNNCMFTGGEHVVQVPGGVQYTWAEWQAHGYDPHGINADPDLDTADEYRLKVTSPCRDAASDQSAIFTKDRDGITRPQHGLWDIGAYEYH